MATSTRPQSLTEPKANHTAVPAAGSIPGPPKLRRRPMLIVVSAAMVAVGALIGAWAWLTTTASTEVVVVRSAVSRGEVIQADDLGVARVNVDPVVKTMPAGELATVAGMRATSDLAAGSLLTTDQVGADLMPPRGMTIVGIPVEFGMLPAEPLRAGDVVRFVHAPGMQDDTDLSTEPASLEGTVVRVEVGDTKTVVDVMVPAREAPRLAARANTGRGALILETRER